jgi:hypothetical protein
MDYLGPCPDKGNGVCQCPKVERGGACSQSREAGALE